MLGFIFFYLLLCQLQLSFFSLIEINKYMMIKNLAWIAILVLVLSSVIAKSQDFVPFTETGKNSVYPDSFEGKVTSSGQVFSHAKYTAAHRSIPIGSKVIVTNLDEGKFVIVTVNDNRISSKDGIIKLSISASLKLDIDPGEKGNVSIEVLKPRKVKSVNPVLSETTTPLVDSTVAILSDTPPIEPINTDTVYLTKVVSDTVVKFVYMTASENKALVYKVKNNELDERVYINEGFAIQVGYYSVFSNSIEKYNDAKSIFNAPIYISKSLIFTEERYRVLLGEFKTHKEAEIILQDVKSKYNDAFIREYNSLP